MTIVELFGNLINFFLLSTFMADSFFAQCVGDICDMQKMLAFATIFTLLKAVWFFSRCHK